MIRNENPGLLVSDYDSVSLEDLNSAQLLNRKDTKFVFNQTQLQSVLEKLKPDFRVLEIDGNRIIGYENVYFDTDNFLFYRQHHNGIRTRYKVRLRRYLVPDVCYFEIKMKNNKDRTIKRRIEVPGMSDSFTEPAREMISDLTAVSPTKLSPKLKAKFSRITLVDTDFRDRVTIDLDLSVANGSARKHFKNLVISEVKQSRYRPRSKFIREMRERSVAEMRISKYCAGILATYDGVKYNRYKPKLLRIDKLMSEGSFSGEADDG
ncbi:MAG: polyphosphate polymerase domain-containing protein [Candidatus Neomarinimicrobiota bacterium]